MSLCACRFVHRGFYCVSFSSDSFTCTFQNVLSTASPLLPPPAITHVLQLASRLESVLGGEPAADPLHHGSTTEEERVASGVPLVSEQEWAVGGGAL